MTSGHQLAAIKIRFGFTDLSRPNRVTMMRWLEVEAMPIVDGRVRINRLLGELRARRIVIPGVSVVERMAAEAMHPAETDLVVAIDGKIDADARQRLDTLIDDKVHDRQSRLSWLREPEPRVASASLAEILEKIALIRWAGVRGVSIDPRHEPRLARFAREGVRYTAQAFQQMRPARRRVVLLATLRELEATLSDAAIAMLGALMGRAYLRARKRLEQRVAVSGREGRDRLIRIATVLETVSRAARAGDDVIAAVNAVASLDILDDDAAIIRRSAALNRDDVLDEITAEYRTFKRAGPQSTPPPIIVTSSYRRQREEISILSSANGGLLNQNPTYFWQGEAMIFMEVDYGNHAPAFIKEKDSGGVVDCIASGLFDAVDTNTKAFGGPVNLFF